MAFNDVDSFCVQQNKLRRNCTLSCTDKRVPFSISISFNSTEEPILPCKSNSGVLVQSIFDALNGLATQRRAEMRKNLLDFEIVGRSKLNQIFSTHNQRGCRMKSVMEIDDQCIEK